MLLYHGSEFEIRQPEFGKGKIYNDYGQGFYCTEDADMGREWSVSEDRDGFLNCYELPTDGLRFLDLNSDSYSVMNWLAVLLENRYFDIQTDFALSARKYVLENFGVDYQGADIVKGYRADDRYFAYAQDFLNNAISLKTLSYAMKLGKMGEQVVLKSPKAFEKICFLRSEAVAFKEWFPKKKLRDDAARNDYSAKRNEMWQPGEIYILNIMERELKNADIRI